MQVYNNNSNVYSHNTNINSAGFNKFFNNNTIKNNKNTLNVTHKPEL